MAANRPFNVDPALTALAIGYRNTSAVRIADQVLPKQRVTAEKFSWTEYPIAEAFNLPDAEVGRLGRVNQMEFGGEQRDSSVKDYGLEVPIPYSDINEASAARARGVLNFDPEQHATLMLIDTIENIREVRVANLVTDPTNYAADKRAVLTAGDRFSNYEGSNPITVIKDACASTLVYRPNTVVMGRDAWSAISSHPRLLKAVKGGLTDEGMITPEQFVGLFAGEGIQRVLIGDALINTARYGQAPTLQRAWGNDIALIHIDDMASPQSGRITWGFTADYGGRQSWSWDDRYVGLEGGKIVRTGEKLRELVVAKDVGFLLQGAVE